MQAYSATKTPALNLLLDKCIIYNKPYHLVYLNTYGQYVLNDLFVVGIIKILAVDNIDQPQHGGNRPAKLM